MRSPLTEAPLSLAMFRNGFFWGPGLRIAPTAESYAHHRNPARRFVRRAPPRTLRARDAGDGEDRNRRGGDPRSVTARDGHRGDDPLTDHDASGTGIGEFARSERL